MSSSRLAVLKFGGTSVASAETVRRIAEIVLTRRKQGYGAVVVVVSALSKVTDKLVRISQGEPAEPLVEEIKGQHEALAKSLGLEQSEATQQAWLEPLSEIIKALAGLHAPFSPLVQAQVLSAGEQMSSRLLAQFFSQELAKSETPFKWQDVRQWLSSTPQANRSEVSHYLNAHCEPTQNYELRHQLVRNGGMVLTQGFMARNQNGDTVILGRGGSDTSAAYLSALLGADVLEIWTDVPGMFTANPRQYPNARLLRSLDYDEAQEMATTGAKVLHPRCVRPARLARIPVRIAHTGYPEMEGTWVQPQSEEVSGLKAVSVNKPITLISMETLGMWQEVGFLSDAFTVFKRRGVSIDLVSTSETNITVTLDSKANDLSAQSLRELTDELSTLCRVKVVENCAVVSLVGRNVSTVLHQLGDALSVFSDYPVYLVSQAASDLNYSFVIDAEHADDVCSRLHEFLLAHARHPAVFGPSWRQLFAKPNEALETDWWREQAQTLIEKAQLSAPCYVYSLPRVLQAVSNIRTLKSLDRVLFAMKANANPSVLQTLAAAKIDFECVSIGEIERLRRVLPDLPLTRILFTPNFASRSEYEWAAKQGVTITLDNLHPIRHWPEIFAQQKVLLRLDVGAGKGHHAHVRTVGQQSKFGIPVNDIVDVKARLAEVGASIIGLHVHSGSGVFDVNTWAQNARNLAKIASDLPDVEVLNLGGGIGIPYEEGQAPIDFSALETQLAEVKKEYPQYKFWMEPGRFLVAQAGVLLARATQVKGKGEKRYVGIETGMNSLLRPALYGAYHRIVNLSRLDVPPVWQASVVGPICETGDKLGDTALPETREGDVMLIADTGAYGAVMASNYNMRAPAQEIILD